MSYFLMIYRDYVRVLQGEYIPSTNGSILPTNNMETQKITFKRAVVCVGPVLGCDRRSGVCHLQWYTVYM